MAQTQVVNKVAYTPFVLIAGVAFVDVGYYTRILGDERSLGGLSEMARQYGLQSGRASSVQVIDERLYVDYAAFVQLVGVLPADKYDFIKVNSILSVLGANDHDSVDRANSRLNPIRHFTVIDGGLA